MSLPAWECGLKFLVALRDVMERVVTPCVGVWIEIQKSYRLYQRKHVTPCVGVWIEIVYVPLMAHLLTSHSLRGSVD